MTTLLPLLLAWWAMTAVMMLPLTWPWLRTLRRVAGGEEGSRLAAALVPAFAAGYLTVWLGFGTAAAALQLALGALPSLSGAAASTAFKATLLAAAGAYQLSPAKASCLRACRSPLSAVLARWPLRPGGALRLGLEHGATCVGCCWALMLLGLAAGAAGPAWMVGLTALMAAEKLTPAGPRIGRWAGALLLSLSVLTVAACGGEGAGSGSATTADSAGAAPSSGRPSVADNPLLQPADFQERAPDEYRVRLETTKGAIVIAVHRAWAPRGADRFYNLVASGWYDGVRFHRVLKGFVASWGIHGDPWVNAAWERAPIKDDHVREHNTRGRVAFAQSGPDTRTTQVFIDLKDNASLDAQGFAPFGEVVEGMDAADALYSGYGDGPPRGEGVYQAMALAKGDAYLDQFPKLDRIENARLVATAP